MLDEKLAAFFGQMTTYLDKRFAATELRLEERLARIEKTVDDTQKHLENTNHELMALSMQTDRHEVWINRVTDTASRSIPYHS